MHYTAHVDLAFSSVVHITRDVSYGWLLRSNDKHMLMEVPDFLFVFIFILHEVYTMASGGF